MWRNPEIRKDIIIGLVVFVLATILIQPMMGLCWKALNWLGSNLSQSFSQGLYRNAALGLREVHSYILLSATCSLMVGFVTSALVSPFIARRLESGSRPLIPNAARYPVGILFIVSVMVLLTYHFADLQLNASFNQRMAVLAPEITDLDAKRLRARWASMRSREDFLAIKSTMEPVARAHGISLPESLWD